MSVKTKELISVVNEFAPSEIQEEWDNSGWQIDLGKEEVSKVLVALEIINDTIDEAKKLGADLILTHHPLFFSEFKQVLASSMKGGYLVKLVQSGISVYSAHTSYDSAEGGMNDTLAKRCGLTDIGHVLGLTEENPMLTSIVRAGKLPEKMSFGDYCEKVEMAIGMENRLKTVGNPNTLIEKVAVCGGAGGEFIPDLIDLGFDLYLTSDIKHDPAQYAKEKGFCVIDGGHFGTEQHFTEEASQKLREAFGYRLEVFETKVSADPFL